MRFISGAWAVLPIVLGVLLLGVLPLVLLVVGLRGQRTDAHPLCRRCGFDLTGKPETTTVCNECGADLTRPNAVRVGHRARRRGPLVAGLLLGLLGLGGGGLVAADAFAGRNLQTYKPLWWLLRETDSGNGTTQTLALNEIGRRYAGRRLSPANLDTLVGRCLDRQGDRNRAYETQFWSDWVEQERKAGRLPDAQWERYVRQAVAGGGLESIRKTVRRGDPLPYWTRSGDRVGYNAGLYVREKSEDARTSIDDIDLPTQSGRSFSGSLGGGGKSGSSLDLKPILDRLADGPHTLRVRRKVTVHQGSSDAAPVVCSADTDEKLAFELTSKPTVTLVHDPARRAGVEAAIKVEHVKVRTSQYDKFISLEYHVQIGATPVPVGLACRLSFKSGDREWKAEDASGTFASPSGEANHGYMSGVRVAAFPDDVATVDVVFTPDPAAAVGTTTVFEIWDEPFTVKNVKVVRPTPTSGPTP